MGEDHPEGKVVCLTTFPTHTYADKAQGCHIRDSRHILSFATLDLIVLYNFGILCTDVSPRFAQ
jgi:hypothetical protein